MKKVAVISVILVISAIIGLVLVFYVFKQETASVGRYSVLYYKNMCDLEVESFPQDLESLKSLPGLIRITWQEQIASDMFQEYCFLPGKGVEKSRLIRKNQ
ncbi:MAG: hypothetical protein A4E71_03310 [Smithella sp. PtaU1.Bin162]|jgi:hypothetical protein|nr:MAG: hypothetical protein A4E71_03310 [Smithella sp. PtaU1.Bin162]